MLHQPNLRDLQTEDGRFTGGIFGALRTLKNAVERLDPEQLVLVWDGGHSVRRKLVYPAYKADRKVSAEDEEAANYYAIFKDSRAALQKATSFLAIHNVMLPGREADDVIGFIARRYSDGRKITVASDDWGYLQLVSNSVSVFRPMAEQIVTTENFVDKCNCSPQWWVVHRALVGTSDNIPGIAGVGTTTIVEALDGFAATLGQKHLEGDHTPALRTAFYDWCSAHKSQRIQKIGAARAKIERNVFLLDVRLETFGTEEVLGIDQELSNQYSVSEIEFARLLKDLEIYSIVEIFTQWIRPFARLS